LVYIDGCLTNEIYEFDNVEFLLQALVCRGGKKEIELVTDIQRSLATKDGGTWCTHRGNFCLGTTNSTRMVLGIQRCIYIVSKFDSHKNNPRASGRKHKPQFRDGGYRSTVRNTHYSDAVIFIRFRSYLPAAVPVPNSFTKRW
jgi:hypothetical protein